MNAILEQVLTRIEPRAYYQRSVAQGYQRLSGADLQGKARQYGGSYYRSRQRVADLWIAAGGHIRRGDHGYLSLEAGPVPEGATKHQCAIGPCWAY